MASGTSSGSTTVPTSGPAATSRSLTGSPAGTSSARLLLEVAQDDAAHALDDAQEPGAGPVHAAVADEDARARDQDPRGHDEGRRGRVGRDAHVLEDELVDALDAHGGAGAAQGDPGGPQQALGVVAARRRLGHRGGRRRPAARPSRTQDLTCALATGRSWWTPCSARPVDGEGRQVSAGRLDHGAHGRQRRGDAVDRAAADRAVPVEREAPAVLAGQPAREQPHERAGVADVDGPVGLVGAAQARSAQDDLVAALLGDRPDGADRAPGSSGCRPRRGTPARGRARRTSPRAGRRGG